MAAKFGSRKRSSSRYGILIPVLLFAALLIVFIFGISRVGSGTTARQKESLERALTKCITECYAEEGRYPPNLGYLTENYELHFNEDRFFVDYRIRGTDLRPEFTIITRKEGGG